MGRLKQISMFLMLLAGTIPLSAQRVLYSSFFNDHAAAHFKVAGKAGGYYWVQKTKRKRTIQHKNDPQLNDEQSFEIYDPKLNFTASASSLQLTDSTQKAYYIPGDHFFDELIFNGGTGTTGVILQRHTPQGEAAGSKKQLAEFPFVQSGNDFILVRSADKNRILILGFESIPSSPPRLHALLFDQDWTQLSYQVYEHPFISRPFIQDDFFCSPSESFDNSPVQLANNGQWLMACPSRTNQNFLLFHFTGTGSGFSFKEIALSPSYHMADVGLYIDNEKEEAYAGVLSVFRATTHKNVHVTRYSMEKQAFDFDSTYHFNTLAPEKIKNENLVRENLIALPGKGFMLLKEYGRAFTDWYESDSDSYNNQWDPALLFAEQATNSTALFSETGDGYTRYNKLTGSQNNFDRGDLRIFYFPAHSDDSCWSGMISKNQVTELNLPYLSYLAIPEKNRLFFLYNSFLRNRDQFGSSTTLDGNGNLQSGEGLMYWKFNNTLLFQQAIRIEENEVAIPYQDNQRRGFAIIRF